ncbi:unnamed protein product [Blepharisma stoltei]|uniref:Uncharacterized protein n=1 Tax=Blepharisma stoltei TaxID=1481888 RepID=A0AAU9K8Y9_9CILI|nr:unnamed protein product [Blepharisma stoltei]
MNNLRYYPSSPRFIQNSGERSHWSKFTIKTSPRTHLQAKTLTLNKRIYEIEERVQSVPPDDLKAQIIQLSSRSHSASKKTNEKPKLHTSLYFPPIKAALKKDLEIVPESNLTRKRKNKSRNFSLDFYLGEETKFSLSLRASPKNYDFEMVGKHIIPANAVKLSNFRGLAKESLANPPKANYFKKGRLSVVNPSPWPISSTDKLKTPLDEYWNRKNSVSLSNSMQSRYNDKN